MITTCKSGPREVKDLNKVRRMRSPPWNTPRGWAGALRLGVLMSKAMKYKKRQRCLRQQKQRKRLECSSAKKAEASTVVAVGGATTSEPCSSSKGPGEWTNDVDEVLRRHNLLDFGIVEEEEGNDKTTSSAKKSSVKAFRWTDYMRSEGNEYWRRQNFAARGRPSLYLEDCLRSIHAGKIKVEKLDVEERMRRCNCCCCCCCQRSN